MKKILSAIATLLTGIYLGYLLFFFVISLFAFPIYFGLPSLKDLHKMDWVSTGLHAILLILIIGCVYLVHKAIKDQNELYYAFKPSREKFLLTGAVLIIIIINHVLSAGTLAAFKLNTLSPVSLTNNNLLLLLTIIFNFFVVYPFSAALYSLISKKKKKKGESKRLVKLYILLLLLFNPISFQIGAVGYGGFIYNRDIYRNALAKCGVQIGTVDKDSPAEEAGMTRLDVIYSVDDKPVKTPDELKEVVANSQDKKPLKIESRLGIYTITPKKDAKTGRFLLGIKGSQGYCDK